MKKIFPLGSECFCSAKLELVPQLKEHKIYHIPFNGCRISNGFNPYFPQREFIFDRRGFLQRFYDRNNWLQTTDGQDIQAISREVNLRRCHLPKDSGIEKMIQNVKASMENVDFENLLYIINMSNDFKGYYDFKGFQHECAENNVSIVFLYQDQFKDYVDTTMENAYNMGDEKSLEKAIKEFYVSNYSEILKRL